VFREVDGLELVTVLVFLKRDALGAGLDGIETVALDDEDKSRGACLSFRIGQYTLGHGREKHGPGS
jgi:hypothetical protein